MPRALPRPCPVAGCPELVTGSVRRCPEHQAQYEQRRGTRHERGYGSRHDAERSKWAPLVESGTVRCVRCGKYVDPSHRWSPDHNEDRTGYLGVAHATCNLRAGGEAVKHRGNAGR